MTKARQTITSPRESTLSGVFVLSQRGRLLTVQYYTTTKDEIGSKRSLESSIQLENIIAMTKARRIITSPRESTLGGVFVLSQRGRLLAVQHDTTTILILCIFSDSGKEHIIQSINNQRSLQMPMRTNKQITDNSIMRYQKKKDRKIKLS